MAMTWQSKKNNKCLYTWSSSLLCISSSFLFITLVVSTILIRSTTWIRWRPGICGPQARVLVHQPPRSQDCVKLGGGLRTRLRTHLICGWLRRWVKYGVLLVSNNSNAPTQAWWAWSQSVTSWGRSFTLWSWSANCEGVMGCGRLRHKSRPSVWNNPTSFNRA